MKNTIKKISAIALAFTLLGTGTAITKTIAPQSVNIGITADAACSSHNTPRAKPGSWKKYASEPTGKYRWKNGRRQAENIIYYERTIDWVCNSCGAHLYYTYETKSEYVWLG